MKAIACAIAGGPLLAVVLFAQSPPATDRTLLDTYCVSCHGGARVAGGLALVGFDVNGPEPRAGVAEKIIVRLRAGLMPPPGSPRPVAGELTALAVALETRIDRAAAARPDPGGRTFQRLNRAEYARAVADLFGLTIDAAAFLPADTMSAGFDNIADVQTFSPIVVTSFLRGASVVSRQVLADPSARSRFVTCAEGPSAATGEACAAAIIARVSSQAWRGRGTAGDLSDALALYRQGRAADGFEAGLQLALQGILVSPRFVFRLESQRVDSPAAPGSHASAGPPAKPIDDLALASRLSFFIWGAGPDARLIQSAKTGALRTPDGLERETRRLLASPAAFALSTRFASQWLRLQDLEAMVPEATLFPDYDRALSAAFRTETERFVDSIVREDRSVLDLLTADYSFLNERLARHYGVANVSGPAFRRTPLPDERRGLLGQGSILTLTSVADRTSPVMRGKWVLEVLLGISPPPPPPNVPALDESVKPNAGGKPLSTRQRMEEHRKRPACSSCHRMIDPLGLALEHFDAIGRWRSIDNSVPVDAAGDLYDGTRMDGSAGLRQALLDHQDLVLRSFTQNLLTYALGRRLEHTDMPAVRAIVREAAAHGNRLSSFVLGAVLSDAFRMTTNIE